MPTDLRDFWHGFQSGVEVAVHGTSSDRLLGVREGFLRFFHDGLDRPVPVAVVPQAEEKAFLGLPVSDRESIVRAREAALHLRERLSSAYQFYVASEGGLHEVEFEGQTHYFVRTWTVILGAGGEAWGASGSVEIPPQLVSGLTGEEAAFAVPGTRRSGGMIASLTGGLESRRTAIAVSTLHALCTLFYGKLESRPVRRR